jgi:hypothetical protein
MSLYAPQVGDVFGIFGTPDHFTLRFSPKYVGHVWETVVFLNGCKIVSIEKRSRYEHAVFRDGKIRKIGKIKKLLWMNPGGVLKVAHCPIRSKIAAHHNQAASYQALQSPMLGKLG